MSSLKPHQGRSFKRARRIEIVARLEAQFVTDAEIARHLGLTVQAIYHIKNSPEYLAKRIALSTGILSVYDEGLLASEDAQRQELDSMIPLALGAVKGALLDKTNPHHIKVALDLLDRSKPTSKISRTEHTVKPLFNSEKENEKAKELLSILKGVSPVASQEPNYNTPIAVLDSPADDSDPDDSEDDLLGEEDFTQGTIN